MSVIGLWRLVSALIKPRRARVRGVLEILSALRRYGLTFASLGAIASARDGEAIALADHYGELTCAELDRQAADVASGLHFGGIATAGQRLGILCRNHRGFVIATMAGSRVGADLVLLNTDFAAPSLAQALSDERVDALVCDAEFVPRVEASRFGGPIVVCRDGSLANLSESGPTVLPATVLPPRVPAPIRPGRLIVLTSGTTGRAKGARRDPPKISQVVPITSLMSRLPLRPGGPMLILPPLFHGYGLSFLALAFALGCPVLLQERFDPAGAVRLIERYEVETVVAVPPMLTRMIPELPDRAPTVRAVITGSGLLHPTVCRDVLTAFGPVLFNLYGSTEEGWSTLATPRDLERAPGTIGEAVAGVRVRILDDEGHEVPVGVQGRICVGSRLGFGGYTGGGARSRLAGLMDSGDLGHRDASGLLFIDGRSNDTVVIGGENVSLGAVADLLGTHPAVGEAHVRAIPDQEYGARLVAEIVFAEGLTASEDELREHVAARSARYLVPREFRIVDG